MSLWFSPTASLHSFSLNLFFLYLRGQGKYSFCPCYRYFYGECLPIAMYLYSLTQEKPFPTFSFRKIFMFEAVFLVLSSLCLLFQFEPVFFLYLRSQGKYSFYQCWWNFYACPGNVSLQSAQRKAFLNFFFVGKLKCFKQYLWFYPTASVYNFNLNQFSFFMAKAPKQVQLVSMSMMLMK